MTNDIKSELNTRNHISDADQEAVPPSELSCEQAKVIVQPIYDALTAASPAMIRPILEKATTENWENCSSNGSFDTRESTISRWTGRLSRIPDMKVTFKNILVSGNSVIVRAEITGTPAGPFMGVDPAGRSFTVMTIDIHEIEGDRVRRTYHVEDWIGALRQLGANL